MTQSVILAALAAASAPLTAKELATAIGKSESRTRELLKADQASILCKKNEANANVFWIELGGKPIFESTEMALAGAVAAEIPDDLVGDAATGCPFCKATEGQTQAGPDGTFLGAALTCGTCGKTYNALTRDEITDMPGADKAKRKPLNPQYRINAKVQAAEAAGGKLKYEKEGRTWVLTKRGKDPKRMTAQEFANETEETLTTYLA